MVKCSDPECKKQIVAPKGIPYINKKPYCPSCYKKNRVNGPKEPKQAEHWRNWKKFEKRYI